MAVRFYDDALYNKIQGWVKDPNMTILKPDETTRLFQIRADQTFDKPIKLPLIALSRNSEINLEFPHKKPMTFDGKLVETSNVYSYQINAIPMKLQYQLDIYTRRSDEGDEYMRNFIFNLVNHPRLSIELPYNNTNIPHESSVDIVSTISDNSATPQRIFEDQFTRWTIQLEIRDAYLFSVPKLDTASIVVDELQLDDLVKEREKF